MGEEIRGEGEMEHKSGTFLKCSDGYQTVEEEVAAEAAYLISQLGFVQWLRVKDRNSVLRLSIATVCGQSRVRCQH